MNAQCLALLRGYCAGLDFNFINVPTGAKGTAAQKCPSFMLI